MPENEIVIFFPVINRLVQPSVVIGVHSSTLPLMATLKVVKSATVTMSGAADDVPDFPNLKTFLKTGYTPDVTVAAMRYSFLIV